MSKKRVYTAQSMRYGITNGASTWVTTVVSTYWAIFLTDAVGFETATMAAIISLASTVDLISVPIIGVVMQKAKFKSGKFRPWLLIGGIMAALFRICSFMNPGMTGSAQAFWFGAAYVLTNIGYNLAYSAYMGVLPLMATDRDDRMAYAASKNICNAVGKFVFSLFSVKLISLFGQGNAAMGYTMLTILIAVCVILAFVQLAAMVKPLDVVTDDAPAKGAAPAGDAYKASIFEMIKYTLSKPFIMFVLGVSTKTIAYFSITGLAAYYYTYVVGDKSMLTVYLSATTFLMIGGSYLAPYINRAINSSKKSYALGLAIYGGSMALAFFIGKSALAFTCLLAIGYVGYSIAHTVEIAIYSSIIDYTQWTTGKDLKPFMMSMFNILPKIGTTIGNMILGYGLVAIGFDKNNVTAEAASGLRVLFSAMPGAILLCGAIIMLLLPLADEKIKLIQADLKAGKTKANSDLKI